MEAHRISGYSGLVVTKLDVLGGLDEIKICIGYELDFGSLVHQVVEDFGRDEAARELADPKAIHNYFVEQLRTVIATRYGLKPPLPVQVQAEI